MNLRTPEQKLWIVVPLVLGFAAPVIALLSTDPRLLFVVFTNRPGILILLSGLLPFGALSCVCALVGRRFPVGRLRCVGTGGLVGLLAVFVPGYIEIFSSDSSTAILGLVVLPFYCFGSLLAGLLFGWAASFLAPFRRKVFSLSK
jgi:hypothetical protein